jgi:hypothetical protein
LRDELGWLTLQDGVVKRSNAPRAFVLDEYASLRASGNCARAMPEAAMPMINTAMM